MRVYFTLPVALTAVISLQTTGCGPALKGKVRKTRYLVSKRRCSQGPLDIHLTAAGARWGERFSVTTYAPRTITGRYVYSINGKDDRTGWFGYFDKPDNARCVASKTELGARVKASEPASKGGSGKEGAPGRTADPGAAKAPTGAVCRARRMGLPSDVLTRTAKKLCGTVAG